MSFDSAQPADTTKIRNLGLVLRNNFQAMASGFSDTSYAPTALNLTEQAGNPGATANLGKVYCKTGPTSGKGELFYQDEDGNVVPMTSGGKLGSPATSILASDITLTSGSGSGAGGSVKSLTADGCVVAAYPSGGIGSAVTFLRSSGIIASGTVTGEPITGKRITLTFSRTTTDANYIVVFGQPQDAATGVITAGTTSLVVDIAAGKVLKLAIFCAFV